MGLEAMIQPKGLYVHHFQNTETKLKSQMSAGHPTVSQNVQRNREGEDSTQRGEFSPLSEPPPRRISAGWWLKQPLQLTKLPFPCQCEILCLTATHSPRALCLSAAQESKAIVPGKGGADVTAALGEKKRVH